MIVEMREYTLQAGKVPDYLKLYESEGLGIQREILGHLVGYYATEVGPAVNRAPRLAVLPPEDEANAGGAVQPAVAARAVL